MYPIPTYKDHCNKKGKMGTKERSGLGALIHVYAKT